MSKLMDNRMNVGSCMENNDYGNIMGYYGNVDVVDFMM